MRFRLSYQIVDVAARRRACCWRRRCPALLRRLCRALLPLFQAVDLEDDETVRGKADGHEGAVGHQLHAAAEVQHARHHERDRDKDDERDGRCDVRARVTHQRPPGVEMSSRVRAPLASDSSYTTNNSSVSPATTAKMIVSRLIHGSTRGPVAVSLASGHPGDNEAVPCRIRWILSSICPMSARRSPFELM